MGIIRRRTGLALLAVAAFVLLISILGRDGATPTRATEEADRGRTPAPARSAEPDGRATPRPGALESLPGATRRSASRPAAKIEPRTKEREKEEAPRPSHEIAGSSGRTPSPDFRRAPTEPTDPSDASDASDAYGPIEALYATEPRDRIQAIADLPSDVSGEDRDEMLMRLAMLLDNDPDEEVRVAAAERLADERSSWALDALTDALRDPSEEVVLAAIDSLEEIDDAGAINDLRFLLSDPREEVREAAEEAILWLEPDGDEDR